MVPLGDQLGDKAAVESNAVTGLRVNTVAASQGGCALESVVIANTATPGGCATKCEVGLNKVGLKVPWTHANASVPVTMQTHGTVRDAYVSAWKAGDVVDEAPTRQSFNEGPTGYGLRNPAVQRMCESDNDDDEH